MKAYWCQCFQKYLESSGMWLSSAFGFPICNIPWVIWTVVWGWLDIRAHVWYMEEKEDDRCSLRVNSFCLWLRISNRQLLCEYNHQKHKVKMLWTENRELLQEQIELEEGSKHTNILCTKACEVLNDSWTLQAAPGRMNEHQGQVALLSNHKHSQAHETILNLIQALSCLLQLFISMIIYKTFCAVSLFQGTG